MAGELSAADLELWAARLDGRGKLIVPLLPKPSRPSAVFIGESKLSAEDEWPEYEGVRFGDGDNAFELRMGDAVYLSPVEQGEPCELGFVLNAVPGRDDDYPWVTVQWLWRPDVMEELDGERTKFHPNELLLGEVSDENPCEAIELCIHDPHCITT